jgi:hypothetical protein
VGETSLGGIEANIVKKKKMVECVFPVTCIYLSKHRRTKFDVTDKQIRNSRIPKTRHVTGVAGLVSLK